MTRRAWIRCLVISLLGTVVAPIITLTPFVPDEGVEVADLRAIDPKKMAEMSEREAAEYINAIPMRRVRGWERITYWLGHPDGLLVVWRTYWPAAVGWFALFFVATASVNYLSVRERAADAGR
jgi:hypothetical protein